MRTRGPRALHHLLCVIERQRPGAEPTSQCHGGCAERRSTHAPLSRDRQKWGAVEQRCTPFASSIQSCGWRWKQHRKILLQKSRKGEGDELSSCICLTLSPFPGGASPTKEAQRRLRMYPGERIISGQADHYLYAPPVLVGSGQAFCRKKSIEHDVVSIRSALGYGRTSSHSPFAA